MTDNTRSLLLGLHRNYKV